MGAAATKRLVPAPRPQGRSAGTGIGAYVATVIGAAAADPERAPLIYRGAAAKVAQAARQERDVQTGRRLHALAQQLAGAAERQQATIDDFRELLEETAESYADVGPHDLEVVARRGQIHGEKPGGIQRVSIAPESFNEQSTLGRMGVFKYNPSAKEQQSGIKQSDTVAFWQGGKQEAQAITVDVGMVAPPPPTAPDAQGLVTPDNARPYGIVEYGSDGNRTSVKFDVGMGKRLTVVGNYVSVLVGMDPPKAGSAGAEMKLGASIGTFAAPSQSPLILTIYIDDLANGATSEFIQCPLKAVQLLPPQTNAAIGSTTLEFYGIGGGLLPLYSVSYPSGTLNMSPIPLAGDVVFIRVSNFTGATASYRLPFQLAL